MISILRGLDFHRFSVSVRYNNDMMIFSESEYPRASRFPLELPEKYNDIRIKLHEHLTLQSISPIYGVEYINALV